MAKLFIKLFIALLSAAALPACALKIYPLSVEELWRYADQVFEVEILAAQQSDKNDKFKPELKLISHSAKVLSAFNRQANHQAPDIDVLKFDHIEGLSVGKKYLVFLSAKNNKLNSVTNRQYGAFEIRLVSLNGKFVEAVRIPSSYIKLPASVAVSQGVSRKDESSQYVWLELAAFSRLLVSYK